jgi:hypothetical protein
MQPSNDAYLIEKYSKDFSTDKAYGQLSVVEILRDSVSELVGRIPELDSLKLKRKKEIEEQITLFTLALYDQGREELEDDKDHEDFLAGQKGNHPND